jgi:hypothetical protein
MLQMYEGTVSRRLRIALASTLLASTLAVGAGACSSSSSKTTPPGGDAATMSVSEFCNAFMTANNVLLNRCVGGAEATWAEELPAEYACPSLEAAVAAGRVAYHASLAESCLNAFPTLSCADLFVGPMTCEGPLAGTVANGATCFGDGDCSVSSYCRGSGYGQSSCEGKCAPLLAPGAACTPIEECAIGYTCSTNGICITDIHPLASEGQSCALLPPTKPSIQCGPGLSCNHASFLCGPTVQLGGACVPGEGLCETFTFCDATTRKCVPDPSAGGTCGLSSMGEIMECLPHLYCNLPSAMSETGTCSALGASGDACTGNYQCVSGFCAVATDTCTAPCTQE